MGWKLPWPAILLKAAGDDDRDVEFPDLVRKAQTID